MSDYQVRGILKIDAKELSNKNLQVSDVESKTFEVQQIRPGTKMFRIHPGDSGFMLLDNVRITNNTTGIYDNGGITVLNRSMSHGNKTFFYIVPNSYGVVGTFGNNAIDDLGTSTGNMTTYGIQ